MSVKKEKINGKMITVSIASTSLKAASYDTLKENLRVTFTTGKSYEYQNVPSTTFTKFRLAFSVVLSALAGYLFAFFFSQVFDGYQKNSRSNFLQPCHNGWLNVCWTSQDASGCQRT